MFQVRKTIGDWQTEAMNIIPSMVKEYGHHNVNNTQL